ncbi:MAG: hypothetical protein N2440_05425 [Actinobacteria bacterium]|nr:hypothetical protein [Actinomycetota bacterium]
MKELLDRLNKFGETTVGKVVIIGLTLVMLALVLFLVRGMLFPASETQQNQTQEQGQIQENQSIATNQPTTTEEVASEFESKDFYSIESGFEIFSKDILRDPFAPLSLPTTETTTPTQTTETAKSIALLGTTYEDGVLKAVVSYDNNVNNLAPGETAGPYLLVSVTENSARFLYGDMPLNLEIGEIYKP